MRARWRQLGSSWLICLISLFPTGSLRAAPARPHHARVALIAEQTSIQPGHKFWVGLHFLLEKHWHIYWVNPGDSGEPPRVEWNLPQGFRAGAINWPAPRRLEDASLVDYGYQDEVLLLVPLDPPRQLPAGSNAELQADIVWLVCNNICVPEKQHVELTLPVQNDPPKYDSRWHEHFTRARKQMPRRMPPGWRARVVSETGQFILSVKPGTHYSTATFFPLESLQIKNAAPQHVTLGNGKIHLALQKADELLKPLAFLKGVLVMGDGKAFAINAPVISPGGSGKSSRERRRRK